MSIKVPKSKDFDLRACLVSQLLREGIARSDIRHEITLDTSSSGGRADVLVFRNDKLHGFELKSAADTLDRLKEQRSSYSRAFDFVHVIADKRHHNRMGGHMWGSQAYCHERKAIVCWHSDKLEATVFPAYFTESSDTAPCAMASLLWRDEAGTVCAALGQKRTTRHSAIQWIREYTCLNQLRPLVIAEMRLRPHSAWEAAFWTRFDALQGEKAA